MVVRDLHCFLMLCLHFQKLHWPLQMAKKTKALGKQGQISPWSLWVCLGELEGVERRTGPFTVTVLPLRDSIVVTNTSFSLAQTLIGLCARFSTRSLVIVLRWRDLANDIWVTSFLRKTGFSQKLSSAEWKWLRGRGKYGHCTIREGVEWATMIWWCQE